MTRERAFGSDTEFCQWMRSCPELPSFGRDFGLSASDNDVTIHRYMQSVDGVGTREVQAIMHVEVKTRTGKPPSAQIDTLSKLHLFRGHRNVNGSHIRFFGVFVLVLSGTSPDDSRIMWWCSIPNKILTDAHDMRKKRITREQLIQLLRFDIHPVSLTSRAFRRHHKTAEVMEIVQSPLGFEYEKPITVRS